MNVSATIRIEDEIDMLAQALNQMVEGLKYIVVQVLVTSGKVSSFSQSLSSIAQQIDGSSVGISSVIQKVAKNVSEQVAKVEVSSQVMEKMSASVERVSYSARDAEVAVGSEGHLALAGLQPQSQVSGEARDLPEPIECLGTCGGELERLSKRLPGPRPIFEELQPRSP